MKRAIREDLEKRYKENPKMGINLACFIDPHFKRCFSDDPEATVDSCIQEALKMAPVQVRVELEEPESTSSTSTPTATSGGKGLTGLLKKITSTRQQRVEQKPTNSEDGVKAEISVYLSLPSIQQKRIH